MSKLTLAMALRVPANKAVSVSASATGRLLALEKLFGSSSTFALAAGTNANLQLDNGDGIKAVAALGVGVSQDAIVQVSDGASRMVQYKITCTGTPVAPSVPAVTLTAGNGQISVAWVDGSNGGATITSHRIYVNGSLVASPTGASPYVITGLTNGTSYSVQVSAVNSAGEGELSTAQSTKPIAVPIVTPGPAWAGASTAATSAPGSLAYYGADTGFTSPPTADATPRGSAIYPAYGYQINAATTWGERCWYIEDDSFVGVIWGAVGADQVNGRLNYVDFYFEGDTPVRLSTIEWEPSVGAFGVRVNLRAPINKNGVARWYARCVPVNGIERLLTGTVWLNSRAGQAGYIDRTARSVWVDPVNGKNEYATANRGTAAAPYRTLEYALTCMIPSGNAPGQTSTPRTETKEGGCVYLVDGTHMLEGGNFSGDPSFMNGTGTIDTTSYAERASAPSASVLPVHVRPAPGSTTTPWITRTIRQCASSNTTISQGTSCRFIGSNGPDGNGYNVLTVTQVLNGTLQPGARISAGAMTRQLIYRQITSVEPGGATGGRGTYLTSYSGTIAQQLISATSTIQLKHNYLVFDGVNFDAGKILDLGTNSTYMTFYMMNCQFRNRDATIIGPLDANGYPIIYRAQGSIGNKLLYLTSINREAVAYNVSFKAQCFTGWSKVVKCAGEYAWDAFYDERDQNSRPDMAIFNYRATKPIAWKSRMHDADMLTVAGAPTYDSGTDTTTVRFRVGPGYINTGDTNTADIGIMAVTGSQAGVIDTWNIAGSAAPADNEAVGFAFNTTSGSTTLTVTTSPTAGKIQAGMPILNATSYFATETHILEQVSSAEGDGSYGGKGVYTLTKAAIGTVTGGTGAKTSSGLWMARIKGNVSALADGDQVRLYATGHGDAMQMNLNASAINIPRENWVVQNYAVTGVDLQLLLSQQGSVNGTGTITAAAGATTATLSAAQNLYAGQCIRVSATQWAFVKTSSTGTSVDLTTPFTGGAVSAAAFSIGKTINGASIVNAALIKRRCDTTDNYGYAIGDYNDNAGQVQQGLRNFGYLCSTLISQQKVGGVCFYFRPSMAGFGVEAVRMDGCVIDSVVSDSAFPAGFSADCMNYRVPSSTNAIPSTSTNSSNDSTPVNETTWALGAGYAGQTVTAAMALAAPFDINGNVRRVGDPVGAVARTG